MEGVPGEGGAFYADGVFADAGEDAEFAEGGLVEGGVGGGFEHVVEEGEEGVGLGAGFALDDGGHEGGGGFGDGAALAVEAGGGDGVAVELEVELDGVAAEGVVAVHDGVGAGQGPEVAGVLVVVEDDLLVHGAGVAHQQKSSLTLRRAAARRSTSSGVL